MKQHELLAPAGSLSKLKLAFLYGADAVYIGGEAFSLRTAAENFTLEEMAEGIRFAHERGKKVYITANIIPHNQDMEDIETYLKQIDALGADAVIVSDLGVFSLARKVAPNLDIHVSTQANNVNWVTVCKWYEMGAKRVVLARELSLDEISEIRRHVPEGKELEAFVHGAMCISYSGRCLLSNYMTHRDSNQGACAHPCRWNYALVEEKRPGQYFPVEENERGTFIFNSKDLCMIEHIKELTESGIFSFKIEGRVKNELYVATVVKAYRQAMDDFDAGRPFDDTLLDELSKVSHREYTTGFYFGLPEEGAQVYANSTYIREYDIVGVVESYDKEKKIAWIEQRNRFFPGDSIEILQPAGAPISITATEMRDADGNILDSVPHPKMRFTMPIEYEVVPNAILRIRRETT